MRSPSEPIWRGDHTEWTRAILWLGVGNLHRPPPISDQARAVALAVFHRAADWNTLYRAPHELTIHMWGCVLDNGWLTIDLAERAVDQHFESDLIGRMMPFHILSNATLIKLAEGA